jgi:hypothetical protein
MQNRNSLTPPPYLVVFYVGEYVWVCVCVGVGGWVGVYTKSKSSELSAPSEIASLREAISSSAPLRSKYFQVHILNPKYVVY